MTASGHLEHVVIGPVTRSDATLDTVSRATRAITPAAALR